MGDASLPLTPAVFHVLLALADQSRHGYGIVKEIERHTDGALAMGPGTLYGTIQRLLESGWITETAAKAAAESLRDQRRRFYRLTPTGRHLLASEVDRMEALVRLARTHPRMAKPTGDAR